MNPNTTWIVDEQQRSFIAIIRHTTPFVPQGHAWRVRERWNERSRENYRRKGLLLRESGRRDGRTSTEIHRVGARIVIYKAIDAQIRNGHLVRDGEHIRRTSGGDHD